MAQKGLREGGGGLSERGERERREGQWFAWTILKTGHSQAASLMKVPPPLLLRIPSLSQRMMIGGPRLKTRLLNSLHPFNLSSHQRKEDKLLLTLSSASLRNALL